MKGNVNSGRIQGIVIIKPHMDDKNAVCFELKNIEQDKGYSGTRINEFIFSIKIFDNEQKRIALKSIDVGDRIVIKYKLGSKKYEKPEGPTFYTYLRVLGFDIKEKRAEKVEEDITHDNFKQQQRKNLQDTNKKKSLSSDIGDIPF